MRVKLLPHYKVEDWEQWEGRWELIEGIPYAMSPLPTPKHQLVSTNICRYLSEELEECENCICLISIDWQVSEDTVLEPDNLIVCSEDLDRDLLSQKRLYFPPTVIFEVLSPSTKEKDTIAKFEIYEREGVKYYVIVDPEEEKVQLYELEGDRYNLKGEFVKEGVLNFDLGYCRAKLDISKLWR